MMNDPKSRKELLEYFYSDRSRSVELSKESLASGALNTDRTQIFLNSIWNNYVDLAECAYSLGFNKETLIQNIEQACHWYGKVDDRNRLGKIGLERYKRHLDFISIAFLLDINDLLWKSIVEKWLSLNIEDGLILGIISQRSPQYSEEAKRSSLHLEKNYCNAFSALYQSNESEIQPLLSKHLSKWYVYSKGTHWYGAHTKWAPGYFGYWSFESAAIVKAKKANVDQIALGRYFPAGMLDPSGVPQKMRVYYPGQDRLCVVVDRTWKDESNDRLNIISESEDLEISGTLYDKDGINFNDFTETRHHSTLKNMPWYSQTSRPEKVKTSLRVAIKYSYQGQWANEVKSTTYEVYLMDLPNHFFALTFTFFSEKALKVSEEIESILIGLEI